LTFARQIVSTAFTLRALSELWSAVKWYLGSAAAASTNTRMDILILSAVAGTAQAGFFSAAQVLIMPVQLIGMYLGVVFAARIMPLYEQGLLSPIYRKFQAWTIVSALATYGLAVLMAGKASALLLPSSYAGSPKLLLLLLPAALTALINFPLTVSILMFTHPRALMVLELAALPVLVVLYRVFAASHGAFGAAAVTSGFAIVKTVIYQALANRTIRLGPVRNQETVVLSQSVAAGVP
jgi:O-antigen/teichoic acid export membrane protein